MSVAALPPSAEWVCTGGTGSLGQFLGNKIHRLSQRLESSIEEKVKELKSLRPQGFLHLAALTLVSDCEKNPEKAFALNADGALSWFKACQEVGIKKFIQVSTGHVFKPTGALEWLNPDRPTDAERIYGKSKARGESLLIEASRNFGAPELLIARIFSVYSEKMKPGFLASELHRRARERDFSPLIGADNIRDFIPARTAVQDLESLMEDWPGPGILHICTGQPRSVAELALEIFSEYGIEMNLQHSMFAKKSEAPDYLVSHRFMKRSGL